jgi:excisionase family DNA binding protein
VPDEFYSVEQVAERLGLHVRTVRNYIRNGRLNAVRIGKQYRIARADLDALTGGPMGASPSMPRVQVASVLEIDSVGRASADRLSNTVMAAAKGIRIETLYDQERTHMKIVIFGDAPSTAAMLHLIQTLVETTS